MFEQGEIVKLNNRTKEFPKLVMVLDDKYESETQFKGVVIFCKSASEKDFYDEIGFISDSWNKKMFEESSWEELKELL